MSDTGTTGGLRPGQTVPDFTLAVYDPVEDRFGMFSLADQLARKRWTVLVFYPGDFTSVCGSELAALVEQQDRILGLGCDILTISTATWEVHRAWKQSEAALAAVRWPMGSDTTGRVSRLFGVLDERSGLALRGTFVVSPEGTLFNSEVNFYNLARNVDELLRKLRANIYLAAHAGESCPPRWRDEGDATLR